VENMKEIKAHIKSVQDIQKITSAMYLIASAKLRKAKEKLEKTRPYFSASQAEIKRIFRTADEVNSRYFYPENFGVPLNGTYACLVITADKGLAGAYNQNVFKAAEKMVAEHPDTKLFVVGECGREYFSVHKIPIVKSFLYTAQNPTMRSARKISAELLELYNTDQVDKIFVIYTDIKNSMNEQVVSTRLLPFHRGQFFNDGEKPVETPFEFYPSVEVVLENMVAGYLAGYIYSALIDSFCSEQNARMNAMNSANQNAEKILSELKVEYNRNRQAAITQEITEITSGAKAQRLKRLKRLREEEQDE
jgi:F-type H+-transporting ATPase subunit gamma